MCSSRRCTAGMESILPFAQLPHVSRIGRGPVPVLVEGDSVGKMHVSCHPFVKA